MELKNFKECKNIIEEVQPGSIAAELQVEKGDLLISINDQPIKDIIDYKFHMADDYVVVSIGKLNGEIWDLEIDKEYDEDIGIIFTNPLIDRAKSCKNKCMFCFVDQLPTGMRETLYFKDDDSRLSFLQGNFITLTNMEQDEIDRIIQYRISPINISVHATDPELRVEMLKNKDAGKLYAILQKFHEANIEMNCQIVLCPGVNDGKQLEKTLDDLSKLYPSISSVAIVPVGLTKHRAGLALLKTYDKELAHGVLADIRTYQSKFMNQLGTRFVHASDEFYLLAEEDLPSYEDYEGFPQIENGVGLLRIFKSQIENALKLNKQGLSIDRSFIIATGTLAYSFMKEITKLLMDHFDGLKLQVKPISNRFFGETITVSGLVTGQDLIEQLKNDSLDDGVIIPRAMLRSGENVFLDNLTLSDVEKELNTSIIISEVNGEEFIEVIKNKR